ncbi:hypothetical protein GCM10007907_14700 [Chitinimonas prasina]|uniref:Right handed beta helix domain-containing protein n=1 Tax=Chitinimonas prasina TaxID=1434937 RepID=A0ABQ5YCI9_9NEIS|nr:right-handed parallel beta-helix repeat-containing protein [Chitinimonas prasina]GLR12680.1 hypothetical protein GCM10007907_14700 [Chitinimonas prasina]
MSKSLLYPVLLLALTQAAARDYYVATNGNDSSIDGSLERPYATLRKAASKARMGDTIWVRGGDYYPTQSAAFYYSGSANQPIKVRAYPGETPIIDGSAGAPDGKLLYIQGAWLEFHNLTLRKAKGSCISVDGGSYLRFEGNTIHDCYKGAIYPFNGAHHFTVLNNTLYHNVRKNQHVDASGGWPSVLNMSDEGDLIQGNNIYQNWGEGIGAYGRFHQVIRNTLHDNFSVDLYLNNLSDSLIEGNHIYSLNDPAHYRDGMAAMGISLANETATDPIQFRNNRLVNNLVTGQRRRCLSAWNGEEPSRPMVDSEIVQNTFACHTSQALFHLDSEGGHQGLHIHHNVFRQGNPAAPLTNFSGMLGATFAYNNWFGGTGGHGGNHAGDINADPRLYNPAGNQPANYMPRPDSPLLGQAPARSAPAYDLCQRSHTPSELGAIDSFFEAGAPLPCQP